MSLLCLIFKLRLSLVCRGGFQQPQTVLVHGLKPMLRFVDRLIDLKIGSRKCKSLKPRRWLRRGSAVMTLFNQNTLSAEGIGPISHIGPIRPMKLPAAKPDRRFHSVAIRRIRGSRLFPGIVRDGRSAVRTQANFAKFERVKTQ